MFSFGFYNPLVVKADEVPNYSAEELSMFRRVREIELEQLIEVYKKIEAYEKAHHVVPNEMEILKHSKDLPALGTHGDIIISLKASSGSALPFTGHAAIVSENRWQTIESYAKLFSPIGKAGVQIYDNTWKSKKNTFLVRPIGAKHADYLKAARYARKQVGKPYSFSFFNKEKKDAFYCSQLVWRAWREAGKNIGENPQFKGAVFPLDILQSPNTKVHEVVR